MHAVFVLVGDSRVATSLEKRSTPTWCFFGWNLVCLFRQMSVVLVVVDPNHVGTSLSKGYM